MILKLKFKKTKIKNKINSNSWKMNLFNKMKERNIQIQKIQIMM